MKKQLIAVAVGAMTALPMIAHADAKIYGRAHVSVDLLDDGADYSELNVSSNSSRLGFRAEKKTESGITGFMQIEQQIDYNRGEAFTSARDTFVGLRGNFGSVRIGQFDSPFKAARGPANLFGDQVGDIRNLTRAGNGRFDERPVNTIHYQTPDFSGLRLNVAYSLHEGNNATDGNKETAVSLSATYKKGPFDAALAYEAYDEDRSRGERNAVRLAAAYSINDALKVVGLFQTVDHETDTTAVADTYGVGAEYKLSKATAVRGQFLTRSADDADRDSSMWTIGIEHRLDSALRVYANYAMVSNDDLVALTPWQQARTTGIGGTAGEDASAFSLGLRFDF